MKDICNYKYLNINHMKTTKNYAAYVSPATELLSLELEGAVLSGSPATVTDRNYGAYKPFAPGDDINF